MHRYKYIFFVLSLFVVQRLDAQTQPFFGSDIFNKDTNGLVKAPLTTDGSKILLDSGWTLKSLVVTNPDSLKISNDTISLKNSNFIVLPRTNFLYTTATQSTTTTAMTAVNTLQINCQAGKKYKVKVYLLYNAATTTTGIALRMNAFTGNIYYNISIDNSLTGVQAQSGYNNIVPLISTASASTTANLAIINADLEATSSGLFTFSFASEVNGSAITIQPNSRLEYQIVY